MQSAIFPTSDIGRPLPSSSVQVSPPSRVIQSPLPGPPLIRPQVRSASCHIPANRIRGLFGSMTMSEAPVSSSTKRTFSQVSPPSIVR